MAPAAESSAAATRRNSEEIAVPDPRSGEEEEAEAEGESSAIRFSPEEEATLLSQSHTEKAEANELFKSAQYSQAISLYDRALASVPNYLEYEIAVLKSNVAACHLKLADWKAAVDEATKSLEALDRLDGPPPTPNPSDKKDERAADRVEKDTGEKGDDDGVVELADDDGDEGEALEKLQKDDRRKDDIRRIRIKALMRRARARTEQGGWGNLQGALEDYQLLSTSPHLSPHLPPSSISTVRTALSTLPALISAAKEKEMGEMMGKLKELGNGILKPFGLSTESFRFEKDERTGGYSVGMK
ncbi:MAG: hypothetical protein LQ350_005547 [Teloschistes chrysophthalmus]|nr:MAG: hypothetical protein LQ350_005547 [Niorma chrysophthalma]